ncbi:MAG: aldo/keto reductase [Ignavibacteriaceae bacterium]|nr:aldo/keto reductase [Ignavibacteriaceae bacterium]
MEFRDFGNAGFKVSVIGFGAGQIGDNSHSEKEVENLLNHVLDSGINLIDTARSYGASEERIGKYISHRRDEFYLSTKVGYGVEGVSDWSFAAVTMGVEEALVKMRTDVIDIVHLHSCPIETLLRGEVVEALDNLVVQGKVKVVAYVGESEALKYAVASGKFGGVQASVNIFDQRDIDGTLPDAKKNGVGVIAKRPGGNAPWRYTERPIGHYCEVYWKRMKRMNLQLLMGWQETALRFAAFTNGVSSIITGTASIPHLDENIKIVSRGKLPDKCYNGIRESFKWNDDNWRGQI